MDSLRPTPEQYNYVDPAEQLAYFRSYAVGQHAANLLLSSVHQEQVNDMMTGLLERDVIIDRVERKNDVLEITSAEQTERINKLTQASERDKKTGLLLSDALEDRVKAYLDDRRRDTDESRNSYLVFADLDKFKAWNSLFTETVNDGITLIPAANVIQQSIRIHKDFAARVGGEEFLLFISDISHDNFLSFVERLQKGVNAIDTPDTPRGIDFLGISIGFAQIQKSEDYDDVRKLANLGEKYAKKCMPGQNGIRDANTLTQQEISHLNTLED